MVPFQEVLSAVQRVLQNMNPNLLPLLLTQFVEAEIFSPQYYRSLFSTQHGFTDGDHLARRLALPVWEKWDAGKGILSSVPLENEPEIHDHGNLMTSMDPVGIIPADPILDLIASTRIEELLSEDLDTSYSEEVWDIADGPEEKSTQACDENSGATKRKRGDERLKTKSAKRRRKAPCSSEGKLDVQEGAFHCVSCVPSLLHFPLTISSAASLAPPGAATMQIIQAFNPLSPLPGILPVVPTYILVSPQPLAPGPLTQTAPLSPVGGTVAPVELSMSIHPASSQSDTASRGQSTSLPAPVSPTKDKPPSEGFLPPTRDAKKIPEIPKNVRDFIAALKSHVGDECGAMDGGMRMESRYVDVPLVQRKLVIRTGKNANKCLEKELVVLSESERKSATVPRSRIFHGSGSKHLITVLGKAGMGKSALLRRLALDWSCGDGLPQFQFVFLLNCKLLDLTRGKFSLKSLLFQSSALCPPWDDPDAVFKHILAFPESVLVAFDTFDDMKDLEGLLQSPATSPTEGGYSVRQLFSGLFQRKILSGCTLLMATRPKDVLNQLLRKVDVILELSWFSPEDIERYVSNYFAPAPDKDDVLQKIKSQKFLFSLCSNPLLCRLACFLSERRPSDAMPSTLTDLCQRALSRYLELRGPGRDISDLCNLAWEGFKTQTSLLNPNSGNYGSFSGILTTHGGPGDDALTCFADLFVQSLLSALLLLRSGELNDRTLLAHTTLHHRKRKFQGEWQDLLQRFVMGLLFQKNAAPECRDFRSGSDLQAKRKAVEAHVGKLKAGELIPSRLLELMHCVYEARNAKLAHILLGSLPDNVCLRGAHLSPPDVYVVWHLLARTKGHTRTFSMDLRDTCVPLSGLAELVALDCVSSYRAPAMDTISLWEALHHSGDKVGLRNAVGKFMLNPLKVSQVCDVENINILVQIHNNNKLPSCESEAVLEDGVPAVRELQQLEYELGQQNGPDVFLRLVEILPSLRSLHHLDLENNKVGDVEAELLSGVLSSLSSLKLLNLSQNRIGDDGVRKISEALTFLSSLQSLSLYGNVIGDGGAESLASVLPLMTSLLDLDVKYNKFTDVGAKMLSAALKDSPSVKSLQMWNDCIPYGVFEHLQIQDCRIKAL